MLNKYKKRILIGVFLIAIVIVAYCNIKPTATKEGYFVPGSIGSDGITEAIATTELKNNNLINSKNDISLIGFWLPDEPGQYKARIHLDKFDSFKSIKKPVLVCVYKEEKYGKDLTWSKIIPIAPE